MQRSSRALGMSVLSILFFMPFGVNEAASQQATADSAANWRGANGQALPFHSEEEILQFLQSARVVSRKALSQGINKSRKLLLEKGGVEAYAVFRSVRIDKVKQQEVRGITRLRLRDDCIFEAAAYRLSRLLGTNNVPPTVIRKMGGQRGTLQLWVEDALTEAERRRRNLSPPDSLAWSRQVQTKLIFDHLVFNDDRNLNNWLVDRDWNVWLIDHTRAFAAIPEFLLPGRVYWCPRSLWQKLTGLDPHEISHQMRPYLDKGQIKALLQRWQLLREHVQGLIDRKGEESVLF